MTRSLFSFFLSSIICLLFFSCSEKNERIKVQKYHKGFRYDKNGWIYLHIEGEPYERGFQHGYLIADEYKKAYEIYSDMSFQTMGITMDLLVNEAPKMQKALISDEILEEMKGIAAGISARGHLTTLDEIIAWNSYIGLAEGWWSTVKSDYASYIPLPVGHRRERCSAFIATGKATKDNKVVMAHTTFDDFWNAQICNIILDIKPKQGHKILMQTSPGYVSSMTDFFIMDSGLMAVETSLAGFNGFNDKGTPGYVRQRLAMQYANTIDEFAEILNKNNNGGNPAAWLIADIKTNEIAKYEQGIKFQNLQKKTDGYFFGVNVADDPLIRNLECSSEGYNDIRRSTGARRVRFERLLEKYNTVIDVKIAQKIMSDHYDVYHRRTKPHANTICCHKDNDPRLSMSSVAAGNTDPYSPTGAVDCKITTSDMAANMKMLARYGSPCGISFDTNEFFEKYPQWKWQKGYLWDRPKQPWCEFISYK